MNRNAVFSPLCGFSCCGLRMSCLQRLVTLSRYSHSLPVDSSESDDASSPVRNSEASCDTGTAKRNLRY